MKDSLFDLLMTFFEKTLSELREDNQQTVDLSSGEQEEDQKDKLYLKSAQKTSLRVFTREEQLKLSSASHQFLTQMVLWRVISAETCEHIINQLLFVSNSRFVSLDETKWTLRKLLASSLSPPQLAFLDLVLYQKEKHFSPH